MGTREVDSRGFLWSRELGGLGLYVEDRLGLRALDANGDRLPSPRERARAEIARREAAEAEVARLQEELRRLREE